MGDRTESYRSVESAKMSAGIKAGATFVTRAAEQKAQATGKLHFSVDPANHPILRALLRFNPTPDGKWVVTIGPPRASESVVDTTGSMGGNVDVAMKVLGQTYGMCIEILPPQTDFHLSLGIFGDCGDKFVLQQTQFEALAKPLIDALLNMAPERQGGDNPEDPQYALFYAAYLRETYGNRIGLKDYHFLISDAPLHTGPVKKAQLTRIFGDGVFDALAEVGQQIDPKYLPDEKEIVRDLLKRAHAFFLQVDNHSETKECFKEIYGEDRIIRLPSTEYLPQIQATIIGLTEGTLMLSDVKSFLCKGNMSADDAELVRLSVSKIPTIGVQAAEIARLKHALPKPGDIFVDKMDLWPENTAEVVSDKPIEEDNDGKSDTVWL